MTKVKVRIEKWSSEACGVQYKVYARFGWFPLVGRVHIGNASTLAEAQVLAVSEIERWRAEIKQDADRAAREKAERRVLRKIVTMHV